MCQKSHYVPTEEARAAVLVFLAAQDRDQGFGNARLVRNLFEAVVARQAGRVVARPAAEVTDAELVAIEAVDVTPPPVVAPARAGRRPSPRRSCRSRRPEAARRRPARPAPSPGPKP